MRELGTWLLALAGLTLLLLTALAFFPPSDFTRFRWSWGALGLGVAALAAIFGAVRLARRRAAPSSTDRGPTP